MTEETLLQETKKRTFKLSSLLVYLSIFSLLTVGVLTYYFLRETAAKIPLIDIENHLMYQQEKRGKCIEEYQELVKLNPKSYQAYYLLAYLYYKNPSSFNSKETEDLLLKSWKINNKFWQTNFLLAKIYYTNGDLIKASNYANIALEENKSYKPISDLIKQIINDETLNDVKRGFMREYTSHMQKSLESSSDLASYFYDNSELLKVVLNDLDYLADRIKTIKYNDRLLNVEDLRKKYQMASTMIEMRQQKERIDKKVNLYCSSEYQKDFLRTRLEKYDISVLILVDRFGDCSYVWETILRSVNGFPMAFQITTGVNDKLEVDILHQKRID